MDYTCWTTAFSSACTGQGRAGRKNTPRECRTTKTAFAALQTEDAAHSHLFGAMTFEHFSVFANNERDSGEKRAAASGSTALPMEGMASHRTTESFEEMVGEERYFIGECIV